MGNRNLITLRNLVVKTDIACVISSIGFIFNIRYNSTGKPLPRGPETTDHTLKNGDCMTEVSASFCTEKDANIGIRDGIQAETSVWTTCAQIAKATSVVVARLEKAKALKQDFKRQINILRQQFENPNVVGWA